MKKNDYNLKVLRYMRGIKESKFLSRDKAIERGSGTRRRRKSAIFISFLYRKIFFAHFFQHKFPFRSCVGEVFDQYSHNFLFLLLLCCYCPFPFLCLYNISSLSPFIALHLPIYCIACVGLTDFNKMLSDWEKIYWKFSIGWRLFSLFFFFSFFSASSSIYSPSRWMCIEWISLFTFFYFFYLPSHSLSLTHYSSFSFPFRSRSWAIELKCCLDQSFSVRFLPIFFSSLQYTIAQQQ